MIRARHSIELREGERVDLLFTPSLYAVAKKRGINVTAEPGQSQFEVLRLYELLIYLAAINAWEVSLYDHPEKGEFPYEFIDFEEWATMNPTTFSEMVDALLQCITGKSLKDLAGGEAVKKK